MTVVLIFLGILVLACIASAGLILSTQDLSAPLGEEMVKPETPAS
ncbi:hypothetical protein SAMN05216456_3607 [Devosia crocina]|uniref:Uncharacterized protein n=1 Tax=Devosia crocina TaxID=429728 RepID=A0A1I7NVT1_9HYPH|nr:hypothetical protein [Devosia crocina]SFV38770.1 hypothetical protein SAMN05216456_3607 [Devosia crocina]